MDIFLAGTPVSLAVPLQDRSGNVLDAASIEYRVTKQDGTEVVARTALADFTPSDSQAVVLLDATVNAIAAVPSSITASQIDQFTAREVRTVELFVTLNESGNTVMLAKSYALEPADALIVGINSFQTFPQAELVALDIPNLTGWGNASEHEKIAALVEARLRICNLNFWLLNSNVNWGQDSLNYVPEGAYQTPYATGSKSQMFMFNGNLSLLTPSQFAGLPVRFKAALYKAQVAEADSILGGDTVEQNRQAGVTLETIGEVKQMFRSSKPLDLGVNRRTMRYLSLFVTMGKRIGRG